MGAEEVEVQPGMFRGRWVHTTAQDHLTGSHLQVGHRSDTVALATDRLSTVDFLQTEHSSVHGTGLSSPHSSDCARFMRNVPEEIQLSCGQENTAQHSVLRTVTLEAGNSQPGTVVTSLIPDDGSTKSGSILEFGRAMLRLLRRS